MLLQKVNHAFGETVKDEEVFLQTSFFWLFSIKFFDTVDQAGEKTFLRYVRLWRIFLRVDQKMSDDLRVPILKDFSQN